MFWLQKPRDMCILYAFHKRTNGTFLVWYLKYCIIWMHHAIAWFLWWWLNSNDYWFIESISKSVSKRCLVIIVVTTAHINRVLFLNLALHICITLQFMEEALKSNTGPESTKWEETDSQHERRSEKIPCGKKSPCSAIDAIKLHCLAS